MSEEQMIHRLEGEDEEDDPYLDDWEDDYCDHDDREVDILEGRWCCWRCGEAGWLDTEQLKAELRLHALQCEAMEDSP
jgi:hypothetical protein